MTPAATSSVLRRLQDAIRTAGRAVTPYLAPVASAWRWFKHQRWLLPVLLVIGLILSFAIPRYNLVNGYTQIILIYCGINVILATSLNLINGYMGEFSVGHAGFMAIGAYTSALLTGYVVPQSSLATFFPLAVVAGGAVAAVAGLVVALPSFKTRGDYLAIVTLAFNMIVKSFLENIEDALGRLTRLTQIPALADLPRLAEVIGGPRGMLGISKLTTLPWAFFWTVTAVWIMRNFVYSRFGRGVLSIREDEIASDMMSVNTRHVKMLAFVVSSFFAGVAGALLAHVMQFINPRMFDILKSTDILVMVYLGGIASVGGSIVGGTLYTVLLEYLRPLGVWRMVLMPLLLVLLMIFRPRGIMGLREWPWFTPRDDDAPEKKADGP